MILILYVMFLLVLGFMAAYMWLNRNHLLGMNAHDSRRLTSWSVPVLVVDILFTALALMFAGTDSFIPMFGLMLGVLVLPLIGFIVVQRTFD